MRFPERLGKLVTHPTRPFLVKGPLSSWALPLGAEHCWLWGWGDAGRMKLSSPFCMVILRFYVQLRY